jgi:hypothetical protein
MSVKKVGTFRWHSTLADQDYDSEEAARHYDNLERMKSSPESAGSKILDSLSTEQIKSLATEMIAQADQVEGNRNWQQVQKEFVANNPDFVANPANGSALAAVLVERGKLDPSGVYLGTMADMQDAFIELAEKGVLQLREGARLPKRVDEAEAYTLPIEELQRRARGW